MAQALIVGAGDGFSASFARLLAREGFAVALAARNTDKLAALAAETGATTHACDASDPAQVAALFATAEAQAADIVLYNPSFRVRGPITELDPEQVRRTLEVCAFGAFLVAQQAARAMLPRGQGAILLTGASAGVKGFARSSPFAMGKFALRGLGEALARELHPQGIHVLHIVVDGGIRSARRPETGADTLLDPDAIATAALAAIRQPRNAWAHEITLRPWVETF
jgi:NAD(P)-dependent dehydrogenase (short-subunit alcohol dehydrogenase family)